MEQKFYQCEKCKTIVTPVQGAGDAAICCSQELRELVPGTTDGAAETHVPTYRVEGTLVTVSVGSVEHPMLQEHSIEWVVLKTKEGSQQKALKAGERPVVQFALCQGDEVEAVYAYCNLHGLWKA